MMEEVQSYLQRVRPLTLEEKETARGIAETTIRASYGAAPTREQFAKQSMSKYPALFSVVVFAVCLLVLGAAFTPSAIRLYHAGQQMAFDSLQDAGSAIAIGAAGVLLAEFAQVVATLALAMVQTRTQQSILLGTAALATCFGIVGNIYVADPLRYGTALTWKVAFAWLEAFAPPLVVLSMAYVIKRQVLDAIANRRRADMEFEIAYADWQKQMQMLADQHPQWMRYFIKALQDAVRKANVRTLTREEWNMLPRPAWIVLVQRELQTVDLHEDVLRLQPTAQVQVNREQIATLPEIVRSNGGGGQRTGEVDIAIANAVIAEGGEVTVTCEVCKLQITKPNKLSATRALAAHSKRHANEQKQNSEEVKP